MAKLKEKINELKRTLPKGIQLVAVSKFHPASMIQDAYDGGQRIFGESHVQELVQKYEDLPKDIEWHFIGHLQTNKVKYIAPFVSLIHSVDSERLLKEIDKQGERYGRTIPVLMQVHIAKEETKFGFLPEELIKFMESGVWRQYENVSIKGLMCMATNTDDEAQIASEFELAKQLFETIQHSKLNIQDWTVRSWGMSDDYHIAVEHGSNMVRIGSLIFGERLYK